MSFVVQGVEGQVGSVTVSASAPGFTGTTSGIINVVTPAVSLLNSLPASTTSLSTNSGFVAYIGVPSDDGTTLRSQGVSGQAQAIRPGGVAQTVTVTSSAPSVGLINTQAGSAASAQVTIPVGAAATGSVPASALAFDPVTPGTATVSATIPGLVTTTTASDTLP